LATAVLMRLRARSRLSRRSAGWKESAFSTHLRPSATMKIERMRMVTRE
jgi:hypothetical protein